MAIVYNVQIHPVYADIVQTHKVLHEREFTRYEDAIEYVEAYNDGALGVIAVYEGAIDTLTGENL
jgi:hypothetical protein